MKNIDLIVFDLDGTLLKSDLNIYKAMIAAFDDLSIKYDITAEAFTKYIGLHFEDIFIDLKINVSDFEQFIEIYKNYYYDFLDLSTFYPGVEETIKTIYNMDKKIALLTTKGQEQADIIIDRKGLRPYFHYVMGRRENVAHKPSSEPLEIICRDLQISVENTMMVGDTEMDIGCGNNAGATSVAVTYGFREKEALKKLEPNYMLDNLTELIDILKG